MTIIKSKKSNLKVIALIKTFSGEEWLYPCLNSIYDYMTKIVMVHSLVSWTGIKADRVRPVAAQWKAEYDQEGKLVEITVEEKDQRQQCDIGYQYIKKNFLCDYVMLVDLDEIWEKEMHTTLAYLLTPDVLLPREQKKNGKKRCMISKSIHLKTT